MAKTRDEREKELWTMAAIDCIALVRVYQEVIGTPHGQIPIPGVAHSRMIGVILEKEWKTGAES
jgi:hypothetical protein